MTFMALATTTSQFAGLTLDIAPILNSLKDAMVIGIPCMIAVAGLNKGVKFIKTAIK